MPIQTYYCSKCDETFEVVAPIHKPPPKQILCQNSLHQAEWRPPTGVGMVMK
jgi:predicted nucleic acid-binding Zn ribbon protein